MKTSKIMKKMLSVALILTMVIGVSVVSVSAGPTDTKTYVLMDNDMTSSVIPYVNNDNASASYNNGIAWGYLYAKDGYEPYVTVSNGAHVITSNPSGTSYGEVTIYNQMLTLKPAYTKSNLKFTYDITTGNKLSGQKILIHNKIGCYSGYSYGSNTATLFTYYADECAIVYYEDSTKRSIPLEENTNYTVIADVVYNGTKYDLYVAVQQNGETITGGSYVMRNWATTVLNDVADIKKVLYQIERYDASGTVEKTELFYFNNIKVENIVIGDIINFGDVQFNDDGVKFYEAMNDLNIADIAATTASDPDYLAGNKWASYTMNRENITPAFEISGNYLYAKLVGNNNPSTWYTDRLYKKFDKIENGDSLTFSGYINLAAEGLQEKNHSVLLTIGNSDDLNGNTYSVLRFVTLIDKSNRYYFCGLEKNPSEITSDATKYPYGGGVTLRDWGWWDYHNTSSDPLYSGKDVPFTLTLTPDANDSNYYNAEINVANGTYKGTRTIPASEVATFDTVAITVWQSATVTTGKYVGFKDLTITTTAGNQKTALAEGENTVYLPIENVTGHKVNFAIVAAVCDVATDEQLSYAVAVYRDYYKRFGNLAVEGIKITDPDAQYVRMFVFNTFENLEPYIVPISIR